MLSIEDTENLIRTMRAQARALDAGADSLEAAIAPFKAAQAGLETVMEASRAWVGFWEGMARSATVNTKEGK